MIGTGFLKRESRFQCCGMVFHVRGGNGKEEKVIVSNSLSQNFSYMSQDAEKYAREIFIVLNQLLQ
jgi:hypothetical protein